MHIPQLLFLILVGSNSFAGVPVVHTQSGDVRGVFRDGAESFKAIPFAAPPVGGLRWMPPQNSGSWKGIREASNFSAECPQPSVSGVVGDEDCLYLNG
jgi:para-nitrobenzyl esterase